MLVPILLELTTARGLRQLVGLGCTDVKIISLRNKEEEEEREGGEEGTETRYFVRGLHLHGKKLHVCVYFLCEMRMFAG